MKKGFTIVEVMIVIAILAILASWILGYVRIDTQKTLVEQYEKERIIDQHQTDCDCDCDELKRIIKKLKEQKDRY